jgi:hypothetical protein
MTEIPPASGTRATPTPEFLARLDAVEARLREYAASPPPEGLTDPDPPTGERWDSGQVWAHLGEFIPYWCAQVRLIVKQEGSDPVAFGRTKADPVRIAAIQADRNRSPTELMGRLQDHLGELRDLIQNLTPAHWERRGSHSTLGEMTMPAIFQEFLVGHLEAHVAQLDGLRRGGDSGDQLPQA